MKITPIPKATRFGHSWHMTPKIILIDSGKTKTKNPKNNPYWLRKKKRKKNLTQAYADFLRVSPIKLFWLNAITHNFNYTYFAMEAMNASSFLGVVVVRWPLYETVLYMIPHHAWKTISFLQVYLTKIIFANLLYYWSYFYYYSRVLLHFLIQFIHLTVLFQLSFIFIYRTLSKKISVSTE